MFITFADTQVTGQGHGMPCPCENKASQHIDIELLISVFIQSIRGGYAGIKGVELFRN
jgi:hypothetical protein